MDSQNITTEVSEVSESTEVIEAPTQVRVPSIPRHSWAAVAKGARKAKHDESRVDVLESQLAAKVVEISDLTERNEELQSQINALQKSLEEAELSLGRMKLLANGNTDNANTDQVSASVEVAPEDVTPKDTAAVSDVAVSIPVEAPSRWWFW